MLPHQHEHFGSIAAEKPLPLPHRVNGPLTLSKPSILMVNILHFLFEGDHFQILIARMDPVELCKEKEDLCKSKQTLPGQQ